MPTIKLIKHSQEPIHCANLIDTTTGESVHFNDMITVALLRDDDANSLINTTCYDVRSLVSIVDYADKHGTAPSDPYTRIPFSPEQLQLIDDVYYGRVLTSAEIRIEFKRAIVQNEDDSSPGDYSQYLQDFYAKGPVLDYTDGSLIYNVIMALFSIVPKTRELLLFIEHEDYPLEFVLMNTVMWLINNGKDTMTPACAQALENQLDQLYNNATIRSSYYGVFRSALQMARTMH